MNDDTPDAQLDEWDRQDAKAAKTIGKVFTLVAALGEHTPELSAEAKWHIASRIHAAELNAAAADTIRSAIADVALALPRLDEHLNDLQALVDSIIAEMPDNDEDA